MRMHLIHEIPELLQSRYRVAASGCWEWTGTKSVQGYGLLKIQYKQYKAHRLSYENTYGKLEKGSFVCHKCDNPICINPEHLFAGTPNDNMQDKQRKGRASSFPGELNPMAKLSNQQRLEIQSDTRTQRRIAQDYGVSQSAICLIKQKGQT